jgi:hypothetical protein
LLLVAVMVAVAAASALSLALTMKVLGVKDGRRMKKYSLISGDLRKIQMRCNPRRSMRLYGVQSKTIFDRTPVVRGFDRDFVIQKDIVSRILGRIVRS